MNSKRMLAVVAVALLAVQAAAPASPPLAEKLPAGAALYAGWAGRSLVFDGSMFGQFLQESDSKRLIAAVRETIADQLAREGESAGPAFDNLWAMGQIAWRHPTAVALYDVRFSRPGADGPAGPAGTPPSPKVVALGLVDLGKDKAEFDKHFQKLMAVAGNELKIEKSTIGEMTFQAFDTPSGRCSMGYAGNLFFAALGGKAPMQLAGIIGGKGRTLPDDNGFGPAMKAVSGKHVQMAYYLDVKRGLPILKNLAAMDDPNTPARLDQAMRAFGLGGVTTVAGASSIVDRGFHEKVRVLSPAPHQGVLALVAGKPLGEQGLAGLPADADWAAAMNLDPSKVLAEARRAAAAMDPQAVEQMNAMLAGASEAAGLDLEKDLIAHLGDRWAFVSAPSLGGTLTGSALMVEVKNEAEFKAALGKLEAQLEQVLPPPPERPGGPEFLAPGRRMEEAPRMQLRRYTFGKLKIRYLAAPSGFPLPVAPAWAVHKGRLYIAAFPQVVAAAAAAEPERTLGKVEQFAAFRKRLSPGAGMVAWTNLPSLMRRFYGGVLAGGTMATNMFGSFGNRIRPEMLPPLPAIEKYVWPQIEAVSADEAGITFEAYGSLPAMFGGSFQHLTSPSQVPMMIGTLIPSLQQARAQTRRAISGANLNAIYRGIAMYMAENDGRFPPDLEVLIKHGTIPRQMLYSPSMNRPEDFLQRRPYPEPDYVYFGHRLGHVAPVGLILAFEKPECNHNQGTNVLYVAGNVKWCSMEEFRRDLQRTQAYIEKQTRRD
jgi:hypothetical protein